MTGFKRMILGAVVAATAACTTTPAGPAPGQTADAIYAGGDIVTVNDAQPTAEAVAVKDGKILAVGTRADVEKAHKGATTTSVDLAGRTPGAALEWRPVAQSAQRSGTGVSPPDVS